MASSFELTNENGKVLSISSGSILEDKALESSDFKYIRDTISSLGSISNPLDGDVCFVKGYHTNNDNAGGTFIYRANKSKSEHNGGTIVDPSMSFPSDWNDQIQLLNWFPFDWYKSKYYNLNVSTLPTEPNGCRYVCIEEGTSGQNEPNWSTTNGDIIVDNNSSSWYGATNYNDKDMILTSTDNGYNYECTTQGISGSVEPEWATTIGDTVVDNVGISNWVASTSYNVGNIVIPTTANGYTYECTTAGTSDSSECTWPTTVGETVTDGTVVWTCRQQAVWTCRAQPQWKVINQNGVWERVYDSAVNVKWFGVNCGNNYAIPNCNAYSALASFVNSIKGNINIYWNSCNTAYEFSPKDNINFNSTDNSWRVATQLVDVKNIYHIGYGATIKVNANPDWIRGHSESESGMAIGMGESPITFRSSTNTGDCSHIGVIGLTIVTDKTQFEYSTATWDDGGFTGISYQGCSNTITRDVTIKNWGTDGLYIGDGYNGLRSGNNHSIINIHCDSNYRQGISIVGANDGVIEGGLIENTNGGSFRYGIDFEPNGTNLQSNWHINGLVTRNNAAGACNHIRSNNITYSGCTFDEVFIDSNNNGAIHIDGGNSDILSVKNIFFNDCKVLGYRACLYAKGDYVDNVSFNNCYFKSFYDAAFSAAIRINTDKNSNYGTFKIINSRIEGNNGILYTSGSGGYKSRFIFKNNEWYPSKENSSVNGSFIIDFNNTVEVIFEDNIVDLSKYGDMQFDTYIPIVPNSSIKNNTFESTSSAVVTFQDYGGSNDTGNVKIYINNFGQYFYYQGVGTGLNLINRRGGCIISEHSGDYGLYGRIIHGGLRRLLAYKANPDVFTGTQKPIEGDIVLNVGNYDAHSMAQTSYVFTGTIWQLNTQNIVFSDASSFPDMQGLEEYNVGYKYYDTNTNNGTADGKLLTFNGSKWVDASGNAVSAP